MTQRERIYVHFANYRFSFRKLQIFISQTTDSHFANYRFPFRKLQILISQTTDFHFANYRFPFRFVPFRFANSKPPLEWLFKKIDIRKSPIALHLKNFRKVRKFSKNTIFIYEISQNFGRFQTNSIYGREKTPEDYYYYGFFITIFIFILIYKAFPFLPSTFRLSCHFLKYKYSQRPRSLPSFFRGRLEEL